MLKHFHPQSSLLLWVVYAAVLSPLLITKHAKAQVVPATGGTGTTVSQSGNTFDIEGGTQAGGNLFHKFDELSIDATETANFTSDASVSNIVGQIDGGSPSYIDGQVQVSGSNADLYLINPAGVLLGPNAQLSLSGSFTATTADQIGFGNGANETWLDVLKPGADYTQYGATAPSSFSFSGDEAGAVINQGELQVASGESLSLIGGSVVSEGNISAPGGDVTLVAVGGKSTVRVSSPGSLLSLEVVQDELLPDNARLSSPTNLPNLLTGQADAGSNANATQLTVQNGIARLSDVAISDETVNTAGNIQTRSRTADGGQIALLGNSINVSSGIIDASGENGGIVRIGSDRFSSGNLPLSQSVFLGSDVVVRADGTTGSGGDVVVVSDDDTTILSLLSATGTTFGGSIKTAADSLEMGNITVDAGGKQSNGDWILNPGNALIAGNAVPTFPNQISATSIESALDLDTNVALSTDRGIVGEIFFLAGIDQTGDSNASLSFSSSNLSTLGAEINLASSGQLTFEIDPAGSEPSADAIDSAISTIGDVAGDRLISLGRGEYTFTDTINIDTDVNIEGDIRGGTILSATDGAQIFNVLPSATATLSNLTFTTTGITTDAVAGGIQNRGNLTVENSLFRDNKGDFGGAIRSEVGSTLTVRDSEFIDNNAASSGGAISASNSTVSIFDTTFVNNSAGQRGGGVFLINASETTILDSAFTENVAGVMGGGLFADSDRTVEISDSLFEQNTTGRDGGGLSLSGSGEFSILDSELFDNSADDDGGGLHTVGDGNITLAFSTVEGNTAGDMGGGLYHFDTVDLTVLDSVIRDNQAGNEGGGLMNRSTAGRTVVRNTLFENNTAVNRGGGLSSRADSVVTIADSNFILNQATTLSGGAISTSGAASLEISGGIIGNNVAPSGGAISAASTGSLSLNGVTFIGNQATAGDGGAIDTSGGADFAVKGSRFEQNVASGNGGAVAIAQSNATFENTTFLQNAASDQGGGLSLTQNSSAVLSANSLLQSNTANVGGAVAATADSNLSLRRSQLMGNQATAQGGGIYQDSGNLRIVSSTRLQDNLAGANGGGLSLVGDVSASVVTSSLSGNQSDQQGGAIAYDSSADLFVSNSALDLNEAAGEGGAVFHNGAGKLSLFNSSVESNSARVGGGLFAAGNTTTVIEGTRNFSDNQAIEAGGGIALKGAGASVSMEGVQVVRNAAGGDGGGIYNVDGTLDIASATLSDNSAAGAGGAIFSQTSDRVSVSNSQISRNTAGSFGGGISSDTGSTLTLENSTLSNNQAGTAADLAGSGGGLAGSGGGLFIGGRAELTNVTISANSAVQDGGGVSLLGADAELLIRSSTLTNNSAGTVGGGISFRDNQPTVELLNTILAGNTASDNAVSADVVGQFIDSGNNLIGIAETAAGFTNSSLVGNLNNPLDPGLAGLADNGGRTQTHLLQSDSVAINAGMSSLPLPIADQRGQSRIVGAAVDIGAVELSVSEIPPEIVDVIAPNNPSTPIPAPPIPEPPIPEPIAASEDPNDGSTALTDISLLDPTNKPTHAENDDIEEAVDGLLSGVQRTEQSVSNRTVRRLEQTFGQSFEDYWDLSLGPDLSFDEVQAVLRRAQEEYQVNSAVVYATFSPAEENTAPAEENKILSAQPQPAGSDALNLSLVMPEGDLVSYQLPFTREQIARQVRLFRTSVSDPADSFSYQPLAQQVYQWLLAPLETDLAAQGIQNLMYALDTELRTAPIAAMQTDEGFALERFGISVVPNVGMMQADFGDSVRRATVAMGVSEFDTQAPLPAVPIEMSVVNNFVPVSQTVLNEGSTLEALAVLQALNQPSTLHLATHATFDAQSPESSHIQFWKETLSMAEFRELDWQGSDLDLLVLSACLTAMSSPNAGLGFAGLAAASGVDATVGSLWLVSDVGTLALMSEFYAQLESTDLRFEALRRAQLALLNGETRIENGNLRTSRGEVELPDEWDMPSEATLDHPFFWSAFTMVGNPW